MKKTALIAILLVSLSVSGCATEQESQYTATGASVGAVTGGILGGLLGGISGRPGEGIVVGSIFGGLAGASMGNQEYHLQRSEQAAAQYYQYNPAEERRELLRIEDVSANPRLVRPGDEVNISATFTFLHPGNGARLVHQVLEIRHDGKLIGRPESTVKRIGGTWVSTVPVVIPETAAPGEYRVTVIVETDDAGDAREMSFAVGGNEGSGWRR